MPPQPRNARRLACPAAMNRAGKRPRQIRDLDAAVSCPSGRWGARRVRVDECFATLRAEALYASMLEGEAGDMRAGSKGKVIFELESGDVEAELGGSREPRVAIRPRVFQMLPLPTPLHAAVLPGRTFVVGLSALLGSQLPVTNPPELQGFKLGPRAFRGAVSYHPTRVGANDNFRGARAKGSTVARQVELARGVNCEEAADRDQGMTHEVRVSA